jgi:hypothetical protein
MSKSNNVNPGQYKVAGRERPDTLAQERMKESKAPVRSSSRKQKTAKNGRKQG